MSMARRGHSVHFISYDIPQRLDRFMENIYYHQVESGEYPLFAQPYYPITLASKMVEVAQRERLDLFHVHYAIPHATSAYLAQQVLGDSAPKLITTLHGTDITLVGTERSYLPMVRFAISESDLVTVPSSFLKEATYNLLAVPRSIPIEVIPNFVDIDRFTMASDRAGKQLPRSVGLCRKAEKLITHVSNFRPVKRALDVVRVFAKVNESVPCHLALIGDGPERSRVEQLVRELELLDRVCLLGRQNSFVEILQNSDVFLLPSETESFGLAALEAMSCGVPVVASRVGGLTELVIENETGFLSDVGDVDGMAEQIVRILKDEALHSRMSNAARERAVQNFNEESLTSRYEESYYRVLEQR
jgi:N-acetyl-alpha-D-glucosaminyl L-malate synthase BshA